MPKENKMKSRVLSKIIGGTYGTLPPEPEAAVLFSRGEGWDSVQVAGGAFTVIYNIQTIDLSGYTIQDQTVYPQGILMQDLDTLPVGNVLWPTPVKRATMVSTTPLNVNDLTATDGDFWSLPGSNASTHSLQNILQGRVQVYLTLNTFAGLVLSAQNTWGSGDSTAAEKIWLCDAYLVPTIPNNVLHIPDQAFVLPSIIAEEPELEYMMRLMRSVEPVY